MPGRHAAPVEERTPRDWKKPVYVAPAAAIAGVVFGWLVSAAASPNSSAPSTVTATVEVTAPAITVTETVTPTPTASTSTTPSVSAVVSPRNTFLDGNWVVGVQIAPGTYTTDAKGAGTDNCHWARIATDGTTITSEDVVSPDRVKVLSTDGSFVTSGGCTWVKAA